MFDDITQRRFWAKVDKPGSDECWEWRGDLTRHGYGRFSYKNRNIPAHRYALGQSQGTEPLERLFALHSCDNRRCVNPTHLRWGTPKENTADMLVRGRETKAIPKLRGEGNASARLTHVQVMLIRRADELNQCEVARRLGVSQMTI